MGRALYLNVIYSATLGTINEVIHLTAGPERSASTPCRMRWCSVHIFRGPRAPQALEVLPATQMHRRVLQQPGRHSGVSARAALGSAAGP